MNETDSQVKFNEVFNVMILAPYSASRNATEILLQRSYLISDEMEPEGLKDYLFGIYSMMENHQVIKYFFYMVVLSELEQETDFTVGVPSLSFVGTDSNYYKIKEYVLKAMGETLFTARANKHEITFNVEREECVSCKNNVVDYTLGAGEKVFPHEFSHRAFGLLYNNKAEPYYEEDLEQQEAYHNMFSQWIEFVDKTMETEEYKSLELWRFPKSVYMSILSYPDEKIPLEAIANYIGSLFDHDEEEVNHFFPGFIDYVTNYNLDDFIGYIENHPKCSEIDYLGSVIKCHLGN